MWSAKLKKFEIPTLLATVALTFLLFGNGIGGSFILDDGRAIFPSPQERSMGTIPMEFLRPYYLWQSTTGLYRPLTQISYVLNLAVSDKPTLFHVVNILIHSLNTWLLFILVIRVFKSRRLAYISYGLFLFLPIHVEAVTYISGRSDLLALFFGLLILLAFYLKKYWLSGLAFLLAVLSKEVAIGIFPFIIFWLFATEKYNFASWFKKIVPFMVSGVAYIVLRWAALGNNFLANDNGLIANPLITVCQSTRILTSLKLAAVYIWKIFFPLHLSADYAYAQTVPITSPLDLVMLVGLMLILAMICLIFRRKSCGGPLAFGAAFFVAVYFPISNLIFPIGPIMADRLVYAASAGLVIIVAFGINYLLSKRYRPLIYILLAALLLIYGTTIVKRNRIWLNEEVLVTSMAKDSPKSINANYNLGLYYLVNSRRSEGIQLITESNELIKKAEEELRCNK